MKIFIIGACCFVAGVVCTILFLKFAEWLMKDPEMPDGGGYKGD